jgi:histidyl-tRNA synthetase
VGGSLGLDRLLDALERLGLASGNSATAQVLVTVLDRARWLDCLRIAEELRAAGVPAELYLDERRLDRQLQYANRKKIPLVVIAGGDELARGVVAIKNMRTGVQQGDVPRAELGPAISAALAELERGASDQQPVEGS